MSSRVVYSKRADEDLQGLDRKIAQRIVKKISYYSSSDNLLKFAEQLRGELDGAYRFRIGDYRAIFDIGKNGDIQLLKILRIKHRKAIYK